jgi:hypothetical protein
MQDRSKIIFHEFASAELNFDARETPAEQRKDAETA